MDWRDNPNFYQQERPYKDKYICGDCCKSFKRRVASDIGIKEKEEKPATCPQCGKETIWIGPKFEPPKSSDKVAWRSIEIMRRIGYWGFFGWGSGSVNIPKGNLELKLYLNQLLNQLNPIIHEGGLSPENLDYKTSLRRKIQVELEKLK